MKVTSIDTTADAYRQSQFYAGEHLAYYYDPTALKNRPKAVTKDANGIFTRYLVKENGQRQVISQSSTKEQMFLELRQQQAINKRLMQQLHFKDGIHYSANIQQLL